MKNKYEIRGEVTVIFIMKNETVHECIIDTGDLQRLLDLKRSWHLRTDNYAGGRLNGKTILMHRIIMDTPLHLEVDHINHNPLDNRRSVNLRNINHSENLQNRLSSGNKGNASGIRGVSWSRKSNKWVATVNKLRVGYFDTSEEAAEAVKIARAKLMPGSSEFDLNGYIGEVVSKKHLTQPRSNSVSGHRNVVWKKSINKWVAIAFKEGKQTHLGYFDDINDAIEARNKYEKSRP